MESTFPTDTQSRQTQNKCFDFVYKAKERNEKETNKGCNKIENVKYSYKGCLPSQEHPTAHTRNAYYHQYNQIFFTRALLPFGKTKHKTMSEASTIYVALLHVYLTKHMICVGRKSKSHHVGRGKLHVTPRIAQSDQGRP